MLSLLGSASDQFQRFPLSVHYRSDESIWFLLRVNLSLTQITKGFLMGILLALYKQKMCSSLMVLKEKNIFRRLFKKLNYLLYKQQCLCRRLNLSQLLDLQYKDLQRLQSLAAIFCCIHAVYFLKIFHKPFVVGENSLKN